MSMVLFNGVFFLLSLLSIEGSSSLPNQMVNAVDDTEQVTIQDLRSVETQIKGVLGQVQAATVSIRSSNGGGSGVIIREDGLILTAAHVAGRPDDQLMITLADGEVVQARVLGCDHDNDIALAIILDRAVYPFVELAQSTVPGQWCLALGHPGGLQANRSAVLRVSRLTEDSLMSSKGHGVSSTASLINGDSGGPLFDIDGRVIGVHQSVNPLDKEKSYHGAVETIHERMKALLAREEFGQPIMEALDTMPAEPEMTSDTPMDETGKVKKETHVVRDLTELPEHIREMIESGKTEGIEAVVRDGSEHPAHSESRRPSQSRRVLKFKMDPSKPGTTHDQIREQLKALGVERDVPLNGLDGNNTSDSNHELYQAVEATAIQVNESVVRVINNEVPAALGVIVAQDGFIVSKASELSGELTVEIGETLYEAEVVATDEPNDLALIHVNASDLKPIEWADIHTPGVGTFVSVPDGAGVVGFGVLSHQAMPQSPNTVFSATELLGLEYKRGQRVTQVEQVSTGGPAAIAGIEPGDVIIAVNGSPITNGASFSMSLWDSAKGSSITLSCLRSNGEIHDNQVTLNDDHLQADQAGQRARETLRVVSEFSALVSERSRDFPLVFLHDTALSASDCGGVLIDLEGRAVGLNIARLDRTSTLAIPADHAAKVIGNLLLQAR